MRSHAVRIALLATLAAAMAPAVHAATEVELSYATLQRMLAKQLFSQDGRKYVRGNQNTKCSYAYLENPRVGEAGGRLRVESRFSGRSALNMFGTCVGMGDSFDLIILATPIYRSGAMHFKDVYVETRGRETFYSRQVRKALAQTLDSQLQWPIEGLARTILETPVTNPQVQKKLTRFDVTAITVQKESLLLTIDFRLQVK
ncbi:MAG: hypothetical protein IT164_01850 [Bryobacterales bacterium]|nr:hypothetical protein [Bryobacterales bacterium]